MSARALVLVSGKDVLDGVGGHETYVRAHAAAAARLGLDVHIFCSGARARRTVTEFGIVHHVGPDLPVAAQAPLLARAIVRFLSARPGPHGIHGFAIWSAAGALASRALGRRGVHAPAVASAYGTRAFEVAAMQGGLHRHLGRGHRVGYRAWLRWIRSIDDPVERWGYANSRVVLVNYQSVSDILHASYGPAIRTRRVPYASADALLGRRPLRPAPVGPPPEPLVLAVSRHDPRKGLDVLLKALAELAADGVPFRACLIGPGRLLEAHRRLAADLGLDGRVAIPGRVEDVGEWFAAADVFVLPSLAEASGSVSILEALRAGTAVIASACDGIPEDLADGSEALLVAPGDVTSLAAALRTLLTDASYRARLAAAGRVACEQRFSAAGFVAALRGVYADVGILDRGA